MPQPSLRDNILHAALKRFQESGFIACTIEDITTEAGAFKGSFYNHFKSKEALAIEVVQLYTEAGHETLAMKGPPLPLKRLRKHFEEMTDILEFRGCLLANFSAEISDENRALRKALNEAITRWCKAIAELLRQAQAAGEIGKQHQPDQLARYLVNAYEGAHVRMKAQKNRTAFEDFLKITFDDILTR